MMTFTATTRAVAHGAPRSLRRAFVAAGILCAGLAGPAFAQVSENVLLDFDGTNSAGPAAPLLADTNGRSGSLRALYGTTQFTYANPNGGVFKLTPPRSGKGAWRFTQVSNFPGGNGPTDPSGNLFTFGNKITPTTPLYGTSWFGGGTNCPGNEFPGCGVIYSITGNTLETVYDFTDGADGSWPEIGGVIGDKSGALYALPESGGLTSGPSGCGAVDKLTPPAKGQTVWIETTLWEFTGGSDGCAPTAILFDKAGTLYGVAIGGGISNNGTFFKLTPPQQGQSQWTETTLYSFAGGNDANYPVGLTVGENGVLYGASQYSGSAGDGAVFALTPPKKGQTAWKERVLWSFTGGADGNLPNPTLIIDKAGAVYGTAAAGGTPASGCDNDGCGTVFKLSPPVDGKGAWTETTLYAFTGAGDGGVPEAGLTADKAGVLYGTTYYGGTYGLNGAGVVFSLTGTGFAR